MSNQISEEAPAKETGAPAAAEGGVEQGSEKKIRQAVYDIRYRARREELDLRHAFSQYLGNSNLNQQEKTAVQEKLFGKEGGGAPAEQAESLAIESITNALNIVFNETASDQKYKVRVKDKEKAAYVRYADRAKINQLRANPQISSVEMTGHGDPYEGDKEKKPTTSSIQKKPSKGGKKDEVSGKDKRIDLKKEEVEVTNEGYGKIKTPEKVVSKVRQPKNVTAPKGSKMKEEVTNEGVGMIAAGAGKVALGSAKLAGKAAVGGAKLAGKAAVKTAKVAGKVGKFAAKQTAKTAGNVAINTAKTAGKVAGSVVKRTGRAAVGAVKGALSNEEYLADGNISAPPKNKKITGEKVDNSKLIKVFPQDQSDPQIGNIKSSYKPVGQVVSEILAKEDMNKGYVVTAADKKGNTPAWQGYKAGKKKKDGSPLYTPADHLKNEGVEVKIEGDDDTPATVDALTDVINSKNNDDSRAMYTKWNLAKNKMRAAGLKMSYEPEGEMTEGRVGAAVGGGVGGATGKLAGKAVGTAAGALAGGAVGGPLGAMAGGAAGNLVGGKVGGAVGGGAGAAAGDAAGSAIRGKKAKNIGKTAAAGAVGGAIGGGKGAAIGGLATGADKVKKEGYQRDPEQQEKERKTSKQTDPSKPGFTGISDDIGEIMRQNAAMKKAAEKKTKKEGYTNVVEDIADILARLEKKRISKGGDPDESPLGKKTGRAMKSQQDKARKKAGLKVEHHQTDADGNEIPHEEIDESSLVKKLTRPVRKAKRVGKRLLDTLDSDPGRAHTIGTLGNPNVKNEDERARQRKNQKKYRGVKVKEEVVNELKTSTLRSYANRASIDAVGRGVDAGIKGMTGTKDEMEKNMTKAYKRQRGINTAVNKLASRAERKENFVPESTLVRDILSKKN